MLEGNLSIELVTFSQRVEEELYYNQNIQSSPHINAIIEVTEIIDEYSLYAFSSILNDNIVIEFESAIDYKVGEHVFVTGSLELREIED